MAVDFSSVIYVNVRINALNVRPVWEYASARYSSPPFLPPTNVCQGAHMSQNVCHHPSLANQASKGAFQVSKANGAQHFGQLHQNSIEKFSCQDLWPRVLKYSGGLASMEGPKSLTGVIKLRRSLCMNLSRLVLKQSLNVGFKMWV